MATATKAQLQTSLEELQAAYDEMRATNELLTESVAALEAANTEAAQAPVPAAEPVAPVADHVMTGFLRACVPAKRKDGSVIEGLFRYAVELSASVNFGGNTRETWDYQSVNFKTSWFDADAELAGRINQLLEANKWVLIRNHFNFRSRPANVIDVAQKDYKTGGNRVDGNGTVLTTRALKYAPDMRGVDIEVIRFGAKDAAASQDLPF